MDPGPGQQHSVQINWIFEQTKFLSTIFVFKSSKSGENSSIPLTNNYGHFNVNKQFLHMMSVHCDIFRSLESAQSILP